MSCSDDLFRIRDDSAVVQEDVDVVLCREQGADVAVQDEEWLDGSLDCFLDGGIGSVHQVPYLPADCLLPRGESSMYWSTRGSLL